MNAAMRIAAVMAVSVSTVLTQPSEAGEEWGRNPFAFGNAAGITERKASASPKSWASALTVEMVLMHDNKPIAVVNGRKALVNDTVDGAVITSITMDSVSFAKDGKTVIRSVGGDPDETN